jgi:3-isopropylmalate dehydrogenase
MKKNIAVILGDGIGPEVTQQSIKVLQSIAEQFNHEFTYTHCLMGAVAIDATGSPLPQETIEICFDSDAILFGAIGHPKYDNDPTAKVRPEQGLLALRKALQLYANIRPISTYPALHHLSPLKTKQLEGVDFIIFRELTGVFILGRKKQTKIKPGQAMSVLYQSEIERVAHQAFKYAQQRRKKLTLVDKANVLKLQALEKSDSGYSEII